MDDLISRQGVIDFINDIEHRALRMSNNNSEDVLYKTVMATTKATRGYCEIAPTAHPERLTNDDFETIRIHLNAYKESLCNQRRWKEAEEYQRIIDRFMAFASAQESFEWCHDCKEYDQAQHCCHRWTKTIRKTVEELKQSAQQGKWEHRCIITPTGGLHCVWECDGCGARVAERTKYCAECGRRMTE